MTAPAAKTHLTYAELAERPVLLTAEVAAVLRYSPETFLNKRRALEAKGFPPPCYGNRYYSTQAVLAWINRQVLEPPAPANDDAAAADAELVRRLEAMAAEEESEEGKDV